MSPLKKRISLNRRQRHGATAVRIILFETLWLLLDKQIRDITATVSTCKAIFKHPYTRMIRIKTYDIDEFEAYTENKSYQPRKLSGQVRIQSNQSRMLYDTSQLVDNMLGKEYLSDSEILANRGVDVTSDTVLDRKQTRKLRRTRSV